jgi:hypothetical protein
MQKSELGDHMAIAIHLKSRLLAAGQSPGIRDIRLLSHKRGS